MANFVRAANPIWFMVDLVGLPLNDGYYISFLQNTLPYLPQVVYRDNQGVTPWPDPLFFFTNGTLSDNLYFEDDLVYRLEIRQMIGLAPSQSDPLIYVINDFIPDENGNSTSNTGEQSNQISNPQFAFVDFGFQTAISSEFKSLTITTAGTYQIAPNWFITLVGTGTTTITQFISDGNENTATDPVPPYYLKVDNNGWSSAMVYQRFDAVAAIWANTFVSMSILARSDNGNASLITLAYGPSSPGTQIPIATGNLSTGSFKVIQGSAALPTSTNTTRNDEAYVDMQIIMPGTSIVVLSDVQVMGQNKLLPLDFVVQPDETIQRQEDHLFHYYKNGAVTQSKDSILTGWNFPLNPWQFGTTSGSTPASQCLYITDQTILYQSTASSVNVAQSSFPQNDAGCLAVQAVLTTNIFALIQFVDQTTMKPYWNRLLSSLVKARLQPGAALTQVKFKMRLVYISDTTVPPISSTNPIVSFDANGDPVFNASYNALIPRNDPTYILTQTMNNYSFEGFALPQSIASNPIYLGIVLYTTSNMSSSPADKILFEEINLVANDFGVEANPKTFDETLRDCQFYYEKSYNNGVSAGVADTAGNILDDQVVIFNSGSGNAELYAKAFCLRFNSIKRTTGPLVTFYSPASGTVANVRGTLWDNGGPLNSADVILANFWGISDLSQKLVNYKPTNNTLIFLHAGNANSTGWIEYQYVADARLGLVT